MRTMIRHTAPFRVADKSVADIGRSTQTSDLTAVIQVILVVAAFILAALLPAVAISAQLY